MNLSLKVPRYLLIGTIYWALTINSTAQVTVIWSENFDSYPNGTTNAPPAWTSYATDCDDPALNTGNTWGVVNGQFQVTDVEGAPCCVAGGGNDNGWLSQTIDISGYCDVSISVDVSGIGTFECDAPAAPIFGCDGVTDNSHDQVVIEYALDGGSWTLFPNGYICGANGWGTISVSGLNGNSLQIRIRLATKANGESYFFDNIIVEGQVAGPVSLPSLGPYCKNSTPIPLPNPVNGITGTWSGPGVSGNTLIPINAPGFLITLTFTPDAGQCGTANTTTVILTAPQPVSLTPLGTYCSTDPPVSLPTIVNGISGTWSGPGVSSNTFIPAGQSGTVTLTFTPSPSECALPNTTTAQVNAPAPVVLPSLGPYCSTDPPVALPTDINGITGNWSGPGVTNNQFNPGIQSGTVSLIFTPNAGQCALANGTSVTVVQAQTVALTPIGPFCQNDNPLPLDTMPSGIAGHWSGPIVINDSIFPNLLTGSITITFNPNPGQCSLGDTLQVVITSTGTPQLQTDTLCANNGPYALVQLADPTYPLGSWSGPGVVADTLFPDTLSGNVTLSFSPAGNCAQPATTALWIWPSPTPVLGNATICATAPPFDLNALADSTIPGTWSGPGVNGDFFFPDTLSGPITLLYTPDDSCAFAITTTVEVLTPAQPQLPSPPADTLCTNAGPFDLSTWSDPNLPGIWMGPGVQSNLFDPTQVTAPDSIVLTYVPDSSCAYTAQTSFILTQGPTPSNLTFTCDSTNENYVLSFDIAGGLGPPYWIDNIQIDSNTFTSDPIPSDSSLSFLLSDGGPCTVVSVIGTYSCMCTTYAGTLAMPTTTPVVACPGDIINVQHNGDAVLDGNDTLVYVLHTGAGPQLGNEVLVISSSPAISWQPAIVPDSVYYISAVAGDFDGFASVDLTDPCLSVSAGIPVVFHQPSGSATVPNNVCYNDCVPIEINVSGLPPFTAILRFDSTNGSWLDTIPFMTNQVLLPFCPDSLALNTGTYTTQLISLTDSLCSIIPNAPSQTIEVLPLAQNTLSATICPSDTLWVNGTPYDQNNPSGLEILPNASWTGCDSTVNVQLQFFPQTVGILDTTLCSGQSLIINGTLYDQNNPSGQEILPNASWTGCDSILAVSLSFHPPAVAQLNLTIPVDSSITINGTVYDATHSNGTEVISGGSWTGCDSTVVVALSFFEFQVYLHAVAPTCVGQFDGMIVIDSVVGAKYPLTLEFMGTLIPIHSLPYTLPGLNAGTYELAITDANGLTVSQAVLLPDPPALYLDLGDPIEIQLGESIKLQPTTNATNVQWTWSPPDYLDCTDCPDPTAIMPLNTITYTATIADSGGCMTTDSVQVVVRKRRAVYVPNIFSPNGDGFNDRFYVQAAAEVAYILDFQIYDRWGEQVYYLSQALPNDYSSGWDGNWRGQKAPADVYVYYFIAVYLDGTTELFKGDLTLIR